MQASDEAMDVDLDEDQVEVMTSRVQNMDLEPKRPSYAEITARMTAAPSSGTAEAPKQKPWQLRPIVVKAVTQKDRPRPAAPIIDPFDDNEDDGLDDLIFNLLVDKASVSLTRSRGPNLTPKQQEIKAIRIKTK